MDPVTMYVAYAIHRERLAQAEQARKLRHRPVTRRLRDRVRQAIGARLIAWGEWLNDPTIPAEVRS